NTSKLQLACEAPQFRAEQVLIRRRRDGRAATNAGPERLSLGRWTPAGPIAADWPRCSAVARHYVKTLGGCEVGGWLLRLGVATARARWHARVTRFPGGTARPRVASSLASAAPTRSR